MSYKLTQSGKTVVFNSSDALFEVNKKLSNDLLNEILEFNFLENTYKIDFIKQQIFINSKEIDLVLPSNISEARWINFKRTEVDFCNGTSKLKQETFFIGFQITYKGLNYKRMIRISGKDYCMTSVS